MNRDRPAPAPDRLIGAKLSGIAHRHALWGDLDEAAKAAGAAELRDIAGDRGDLLSELAGISLGAAEGKDPEHEAQAQAIAELCRLADADEGLIPQWAEEGKRRVEVRRMPPFSRPDRVHSGGHSVYTPVEMTLSRLLVT